MQTQANHQGHLKLIGYGLLLGAVPALTALASADAPTPNAPVVVQVQPAATENATLSVVAADGVKSDAPSVGKLDLGAVDSLAMPKIEHDFVLRNNGKAPLTIERIQPTCGCTSVLMGEKETTKTLAPGEEVKVHVEVDVTRFHGAIRKAVRAYGADNTLLATMEVAAVIQDPVTFSSRQIDFGRVNFGTGATFPLDVTLSPRLLDKRVLPKLVSTNPNIQITPVEDKATAKATTPTSTASNVRRYTVALAPTAPIGQLTGMLTFALPEADAAIVEGHTQEKPAANSVAANTVAANTVAANDVAARLNTALETAMVAVTGEVVGKISANPNMVIFGAAKEAQVTLTGASPAVLKNLKVTSPSPWVKARVLTPAKAEAVATLNTATLELTLDPRTPAGTLQTQLIVTAADGERLSLPLLAEVAPAQ